MKPRDAANLALVDTIATNSRPILLVGAAVTLGLACFVVRALRRHSWNATLGGIVAGVAALMLFVQAFYHPVLAQAHTFEPFMARVRTTVGTESPLYFFRVVDRSRAAGPKGDRRLLLVRAARPAAERLATGTASSSVGGPQRDRAAEPYDVPVSEL